MTFRVQPITIVATSLAVFLAILSAPSPATAAIESRNILKTFFETGDIPTQDQFTTLIDSTLNVISDRYLLGLRQYDPTLVYRAGDPALAIKRFGIGDTTPAPPLGTTYADPHTTPMAFAPDFAGQFGFAALQLSDSTGQTYYGFAQLYMSPVATDGSPTAIQLQYIEFDDTPNTPVTAFAVPEPASAGLLIIGGIAFASRRRKCK